jgi:hypothetical protein
MDKLQNAVVGTSIDGPFADATLKPKRATFHQRISHFT